MSSAFYLAGFEPWDVTMTDLLEGRVRLDDFRGVAFVGGSSYADVLDSAKAGQPASGSIKSLGPVRTLLSPARHLQPRRVQRCQLMALLGWVPWGRGFGTSSSRASSITSQAASSPALQRSRSFPVPPSCSRAWRTPSSASGSPTEKDRRTSPGQEDFQRSRIRPRARTFRG